ncbi:hypothetical protein ACQPXM_25040 [Kribbella sp. CA-253562]|uniref:hypothetical protein n=1 Tax=Kribbella sp. CA-253562 TaxID=3239942 RepID=UPI003D8C957F
MKPNTGPPDPYVATNAAGSPPAPHWIVNPYLRSSAATASEDFHSRSDSSAYCQIASASRTTSALFASSQASAVLFASLVSASPLGAR